MGCIRTKSSGTSVSALISDAVIENTMVNPVSLKSWPAKPSISEMGKNTTMVVAVEAMTEPVTRLAPAATLSLKLRSSVRARKQLSITTIELSTIIPMPTTRPPNDIMLMVMSKADIMTSAAMTEIGIDRPTMSEARHSPKKKNSTTTETMSPIIRDETTLLMLSMMVSPLLELILISRPKLSSALNSSTKAAILSQSWMVFALCSLLTEMLMFS
ncbi:hypothetical protein DSECCO2_601170 [anaerobic digester metagenome]